LGHDFEREILPVPKLRIWGLLRLFRFSFPLVGDGDGQSRRGVLTGSSKSGTKVELGYRSNFSIFVRPHCEESRLALVREGGCKVVT